MRDNANEMHDRLVELLQKRSCFYNKSKCNGRCSICDYVTIDDDDIGKLADHLLAKGATILPYLIGTKLYHNVVLEDEPQEFEVVGFYCEDKPKLVHTEFEFNGKRYSRTYDIDDEGQLYFLSKDAAIQSKNAKKNG